MGHVAERGADRHALPFVLDVQDAVVEADNGVVFGGEARRHEHLFAGQLGDRCRIARRFHRVLVVEDREDALGEVAALEHRHEGALKEHPVARLILVLGGTDPGALCCAEEFTAWHEAGVEIICTVDEADDAWEGPTGFVQDQLEGLTLDPARTVAHVAGIRPMEEAVRAKLASLGLAPDQVRANY